MCHIMYMGSENNNGPAVLNKGLPEQVVEALPIAALGTAVFGHPQGTMFGIASMVAADVAAQNGAAAAIRDLARHEEEQRNGQDQQPVQP